jgi:2-keto-4-pentenoate hydratase/2-oxohepta-3-ene-1,7-dioic acid hydratase in catechol pathway
MEICYASNRYFINPLWSEKELEMKWQSLSEQHGSALFLKARCLAKQINEPDDPQIVSTIIAYIKIYGHKAVTEAINTATKLSFENGKWEIRYIIGILQKDYVPLSRLPSPADFYCLHPHKEKGRLLPLDIQPQHIYGMGFTYATHIKETGFEFDPDKPPPVFKKDLISLNISADSAVVPTRRGLIACAERIEPGLGQTIDKKLKHLPPLLDYEGELAFVLLEDIDWQKIDDPGYAPRLGYFLANDISARTIAVLGEGKTNQYDYWGASKSFPGFLPVGEKIWVPNTRIPDSILRINIITEVNGKVRQNQSTTDMMYTPREMLLFISKKYPDELPQTGDIVLMGTPGGVAMQVPAWKRRLADALRLDRFARLKSLINSNKSNKRFLKPGDTVTVSGGILGEVKTRIVERR